MSVTQYEDAVTKNVWSRVLNPLWLTRCHCCSTRVSMCGGNSVMFCSFDYSPFVLESRGEGRTSCAVGDLTAGGGSGLEGVVSSDSWQDSEPGGRGAGTVRMSVKIAAIQGAQTASMGVQVRPGNAEFVDSFRRRAKSAVETTRTTRATAPDRAKTLESRRLNWYRRSLFVWPRPIWKGSAKSEWWGFCPYRQG